MHRATDKPGTVDRLNCRHPFRILFCTALVFLFAITAPVLAAVITIDPGIPGIINTTIAAADSGDSIVLNPGTYFEHDIVIRKDITIRANPDAGGNAANTIIDAEFAGRVIDDSGGYQLLIDSLTLRNGHVIGSPGGAIFGGSPGNITVTSSVISNCSADIGGALYSPFTGGAITVVSSTINDCSARYGGALYSGVGTTTTVTSSSITNCSAENTGGVFYGEAATTILLTSSTISHCSAANGLISTTDCDIRFNRFVNNNGLIIANANNVGNKNAMNNWWGSNADPSVFNDANVNVSPWLTLNVNASPSSISPEGSSVIRMSLTTNSDGADTAGGDIFVPDGIPDTFTVTAGSGSISPLAAMTVRGDAQTTFTPAGAGTSTVAATVDNQTVFTNITVTSQALPVPYIWVSPASGDAPLTVQFMGDSDGSPLSWNWSFGDGSFADERNFTHIYQDPGIYTVNLTVEYPEGINTTSQADMITVTVPVEPVVANFTANRTAGLVPLAVRFTDESSGSPVSWAWNFGDGSNSMLQDPVHTYTSAGNYTVSLTVTSAQGSNTTLRTGYIQATSGTKPVAAFTANKTSGKRPLAVGFTDQSAGSPTSWKWTFGDGTTSTLQNPVHTYSRAGSYTVSLTVTNAYGSDRKSRINYIRVRAR